MLIGLIGDLHLGIRDGNEAFLDFQLNWLEKTIESYKKAGVERIIQLGDMFDVRKNTNNQVLTALIEVFIPMVVEAGIPWYVLVGNHDLYYRRSTRVHTTRLLTAVAPDMFKVIDTPTEIDGIAMFPWVCDDNIEAVDAMIKSTTCDIAVGHFEFSGFSMYANHTAAHGMDSSAWSKFNHVYSGHYHTVSTKGNVTYCGSPYHLTWADEPDGANRGWWLLDTNTRKAVLQPNDIQDTLFVTYTYDSAIKYEPSHLTHIEGKIARVVVNDKPDIKAYNSFVKILNQTNTISHRIIDNTIVDVNAVPSVQVDHNVGIDGIITAYCEEIAVPQPVVAAFTDLHLRAKSNIS